MSENLDLGLIQLDPQTLAKELRQDFKDDWFPDSLNFDDRLTADGLREALGRMMEETDGEFAPTGSRVQNIPKKRFVLRYSLEVPFVDRAYYHALARHIQPLFDPILDPRVLSHRWNSAGSRGERYIFKHPIEQWSCFQEYVRDQAGNSKVVLITDIQNYYENISIEKLTDILKSNVPRLQASASDKRVVRSVADELGRCLSDWCFTTSNGLPQNRDASSILANIYMSPIDEHMIAKGYDYYRYMDDIRIVVSDRFAARAALQELITELRKLHLNVNPSKTMILEPDDLERDKELGLPDRELQVIDQMWRSRSRTTVMRSLGHLKDYSIRLATEGRTQERGFRFCVKRFENVALCRDLVVPTSFYRDFIDTVVNELDAQPYTSDQLVRFLKAAPLEEQDLSKIIELISDQTRSIYDWQNYLLWQLLLYHEHREEGTLELARTVFRESSRSGDRAGSALFLGAYGEEEDRRLIASRFNVLESPIEFRSAIVAIHELPFDNFIKTHVAPHMPTCHKGVYRALQNSSLKGKYYTPLPAVHSKMIYDEVSQYD